ncbi:MAG: hypothetical protein COC01_04375 [Bacteroidetes bacterium]|nr:hypothetical protein [Bacteroidia bacterium]PCH68138.1 MAG: hypothetical protein COC01_04375 [Bacteroidota bacterium]
MRKHTSLMNIGLMTILLAFVSLTFVGCSKKGCTDSTATNYDADAKEDDGSCEFDDRDDFVGSYTGMDMCNSGGENQYGEDVTIMESGSNMMIMNFADTVNIDNVTASGDNLTLPMGAFTGIGMITGSGTISGTTITITWYKWDMNMTTTTDTCVTTLTAK